MTVYDYKNQRWIDGQEAVGVRCAQIEQELEILHSGRVEEYVKFANIAVVADRIQSLKAELATL